MTEDTEPEKVPLEQATLGGGCFWGIEAAFRRVDGVIDTSVGFMGGSEENPSYTEVCSGKTGHTEVVRVIYDPTRVNFREVLEIFFRNHDPTTPDRQGDYEGRQYRSVIFYHSPEQKAEAEVFVAGLDRSGRFPAPVVTAAEPASGYYPAEEYHQQYYEKCVNCRPRFYPY